MKPTELVPCICRGLESPLPRTKSPGLHPFRRTIEFFRSLFSPRNWSHASAAGLKARFPGLKVRGYTRSDGPSAACLAHGIGASAAGLKARFPGLKVRGYTRSDGPSGFSAACLAAPFLQELCLPCYGPTQVDRRQSFPGHPRSQPHFAMLNSIRSNESNTASRGVSLIRTALRAPDH